MGVVPAWLSINPGRRIIEAELDSHISTTEDNIENISNKLTSLGGDISDPLSKASQDIDQANRFLASRDYYRSYVYVYRSKREIFDSLLFFNQKSEFSNHSDLEYFLDVRKSSYRLLAKDMLGRFSEDTEKDISKLLEKESGLTTDDWRELSGAVEIQRISEKRDLVIEELKNDRLIRHLSYFDFLAIFSVAAITIFTVFQPVNLTRIVTDPLQARYILYFVIFGAFGSSISGILSKRKYKTVPSAETKAGFWVGFTKIVVGAVSAVVIVVAIYAELINVGEVTFAKLLTLSFASGFTEKLLRRAIQPYISENEQ